MRFTNKQVLKRPEIILEQINKKIKDIESSRDQSSPSGAGGLRPKAIIFSAGLGTRFKPWTDAHPKALALVNGKSLLQRNIEYLQAYGITNVVVNIHHFPEQIINAIKENNGWGSKVIISDETNEVLETGGGLVKAKHLLDDSKPFFSLNVDILTNLDLNKLLAFHQLHKPLVTFGVTNRKSSRILLFDDNNRLRGWRNLTTGEEKGPHLNFTADEKATIHLTAKAYSCVVIYEPEIFGLIKQQGKFSIMDTYLDLAAEHVILGYDHSGDKLVDVGKPESVEVAEKLFL